VNRLLRHLPNSLSALRLIAAPFAAYLILRGFDTAALLVFALAGLSDALDGWLAKTFSLTSRFGAWLDPAADKLLMLLCFVTLAHVSAVSWFVVTVVIGRDLLIVLGIFVAKLVKAPLEVKPLIVGKISTLVQILYVSFVLLTLAVDWHAPRIEYFGARLVMVAALWSIVAYAGVWLKAMARLVRASL
jgi:cardiolipin synthase (CMP-forming)